MRPGEARRLYDALWHDDPPEADDPGASWVQDWRRPPERLGRYRLLTRLGSGGMGVVYEAQQDEPSRRVALKLGARQVASTSAEQRFRLESEALGRLRHPGIATVYESGLHEDPATGARVPWVAMELIEGARPLDRFCDEEDVSVRERVALLADVCDAVHHGHQKGVVHRDLKPDNILVGVDGRPRVIDFGVARLTGEEDPRATVHAAAKQIIGTLRYMSPEQLDPDPDEVDTRADVYALGVVLYELLCGRTPHELTGDSVAAAVASLRETTPPRPRDLVPTLARDLEAVVLKAMEHDRDRRYASTAEFAADLRAHLAGAAVSARPPGPWRRFARWIERHPIAATAAACVALLGSTAALAGVYIYLVFTVPAGVRYDGGSEAYLVSRGGAILHAWSNAVPDLSRPPVRRIETGDPDRPWLVAVRRMTRTGDVSHVVVYDPSNPTEPLWTSHMALYGHSAPHPDWRHRREGELWQLAPPWLAADVFPEHPGEEIVLVGRFAPWFPAVVSVHDGSTGDVLHRVWHPGWIGDIEWVEAHRVFVATGVNNCIEPSGAGAEDLNPHHPVPVVFAWDPVHGRVDTTWLAPPGAGSPTEAVWYSMLTDPRIVGKNLDFHLSSGGGWTLQLRLGMLPRRERGVRVPADIHWVLDREGPIDRSPVFESSYRALLHDLPEAERASYPDDEDDPRLRWIPAPGKAWEGGRPKADEAGRGPPR